MGIKKWKKLIAPSRGQDVHREKEGGERGKEGTDNRKYGG